MKNHEDGGATSGTGRPAGGTDPSVRDNGNAVRDLLAAGLRLIELGLPIVPVGADKDPKGVIRWRKGDQDYVTEAMTADQWRTWAPKPNVHGIAVLGSDAYGSVILDIEKPGMDETTIQAALNALPATCQQPTLSGGRHAYVIVEGEHPGGAAKLAQHPPLEGQTDPLLLAERRGHASYAVIVGPGRPPLPPDFEPVRLNRDEYDAVELMIKDAGTFTREPPQVKPYNRTGKGGGTGDIVTQALKQGALSPSAVLPDGWTVVGQDRDGRTYIRRPDTESDTSGNVRDGVVVIWSSAVDWAEPGKGYSGAETLARARHRGDFHAALSWVETTATEMVLNGTAPPAHWPPKILTDVFDSIRAGAPDPWEPGPPGEIEPDSDHAETSRFNSWQRQPLDDILDGEYVPEVATLLPRIDGVGLLYPGRTHSIHAESESGKSLILQYEAARLLNLGEAVAYIDYESDRASVVRRLLDLGANPEALRARFDYRRPETAPRVGTDEHDAWLRLLDSRYALVVIDGVTEAMDLMAPKGAGVDVNERIAGFLRRFPNRIAEQTDGAVVLIDHVVKNTESRGRHAIGGQHKMNGLTGAAYTVEVKTQPRRGHVGELHLFVAKDRPSGVRPYCGQVRPDRTQLAAIVIIDSTGEQMSVTVKAPSGYDTDDDRKPFRPTYLMERLSRWLETNPGQHSRSETTDAVQGKKKALLFALDLLAAEGYATVIERERGSATHRYYTHERLFTEVTDPASFPDNDNTVPSVPTPFPDRSQERPVTDRSHRSHPLLGGTVDGARDGTSETLPNDARPFP